MAGYANIIKAFGNTLRGMVQLECKPQRTPLPMKSEMMALPTSPLELKVVIQF